MRGWNSKSPKTKNYVYVEMYDCYENIKMKFWSTFSTLKPWRWKFLTTFLTMFCKFCKLMLYRLGDAKQYHYSWLNRLISYRFIMHKMYIRKTSLEQDLIKDKSDPRREHNQRESKRPRSPGVKGWTRPESLST